MRTRIAGSMACVLAVAASSPGCGGRTTLREEHTERDSGLVESVPACDVDLLFVVDDSHAMDEEQSALAAALPSMLAALAGPDLDRDGTPDAPAPASVHIGVVTTDMGGGGHAVPTCEDAIGDDALLRTAGAGVRGCLGEYPRFFSFAPAGASASPERIGRELACVTTCGTAGCGFEQPLEAMLKALAPASSDLVFARGTTGHGDGFNAGFLRDTSILAVVVVTNEDDCSVLDLGLMNPSDRRFSTDLNLRCGLDEEALQPISRFADGLRALRASHPERLLMMSIAGVPIDLTADPDAIDYERARADPRMSVRPDPTNPGYLVPACDLPEMGPAMPARRLAALAEALGPSGILQSICDSDLSSPLAALVRRIGAVTARGCPR